MMDPNDIRTKEEFVEFVYYLRNVYRNEPSRWQNDTTESYLDALAGWVESMEGAYLNRNEKMPQDVNWNVIARMLGAATIYD